MYIMKYEGMEAFVCCNVHTGGVISINPNGSVSYSGGRMITMLIDRTRCHNDFINAICVQLNIERNLSTFHYMHGGRNINFHPLVDDASMENMLSTSGSSVELYILTWPTREGGRENVLLSNMGGVDGGAMICCTDQTSGLSRKCAEVQSRPLESMRWNNVIRGSGQTFVNADEFRDAVYLMSVAGRFKYDFKRNYPRHMSVYCKAKACPWKITCRSIGNSSIVRVHTFRNVHAHSIDDIANTQPAVKPKHSSAMVDETIRCTPDYQPRQICKDFLRQHGIHLSYHQAWKLKEKANKRLYGEPCNYYKLLPWLCARIQESNPTTVIDLCYSSDFRFEQLFIAYGVSTEGFAKGCRPLIALDSCHMSGPYGGALFAANAYDADDSLFTLAFGIVSSENYEDWLWFLKNVKKVIGDRDVVVLSDRHPGLLRAVPEIFGAENHSYCYRHLKENFSSYITKHGKLKQRSKEDALAFLDGVAYARLRSDYQTALNELSYFNQDFAEWVRQNSPERWAMSQFGKKRWDKLTTNLAESFNGWLRNERHDSVCSFVIKHLLKMANMLATRKSSFQNWDGLIGPRVRAKLLLNLRKGEGYPVYTFFNGSFGVQVAEVIVRVNIRTRTCTCKGWEMSGLPCEHACAVILYTKQNPAAFVEEWFKAEKQEMIYGGDFTSIETHDMPEIGTDGIVRDVAGEEVLSLRPPDVKKPPGRPRKNRIESQFMQKRPIYCSRCLQPGHNRRNCKGPLPDIA